MSTRCAYIFFFLLKKSEREQVNTRWGGWACTVPPNCACLHEMHVWVTFLNDAWNTHAFHVSTHSLEAQSDCHRLRGLWSACGGQLCTQLTSAKWPRFLSSNISFFYGVWWSGLQTRLPDANSETEKRKDGFSEKTAYSTRIAFTLPGSAADSRRIRLLLTKSILTHF
jgi:hypothetical protein